VFTSNPDDPNKKKPLWLGRFLFLAFIYMAAGDLNVLLPAFLSSLESLDEVRRRTIFRIPSSYF
jgi:hypothetical protein